MVSEKDLGFRARAQRRIPMVDEASFMTFDQAMASLEISGFTFGHLLSEGSIRMCKLDDGRHGVTRQSVEDEVVFQRDANWRQRVGRIICRLVNMV